MHVLTWALPQSLQVREQIQLVGRSAGLLRQIGGESIVIYVVLEKGFVARNQPNIGFLKEFETIRPDNPIGELLAFVRRLQLVQYLVKRRLRSLYRQRHLSGLD